MGMIQTGAMGMTQWLRLLLFVWQEQREGAFLLFWSITRELCLIWQWWHKGDSCGVQVLLV